MSKNKEKKIELKSTLLEGGEDQVIKPRTEEGDKLMSAFQDKMITANKRMSNVDKKTGFLANLGRNNKKREEDKSKESCAEKVFTTNCVYFTYGIIDLLLLAFLLTVKFVYKRNGYAIFISIAVYIVNCILFSLVLCKDSINTRYFYQRFLRVKLVMQGVGLPIVAFIFDEYVFEAKTCAYLWPEYGDQAYYQSIIDDQNFTLLASTDGLQTNSLNVQDIQRKGKIAEMRKDINVAQGLAENRLSASAVDAILSLTASTNDTDVDVEKLDGAPKLPLTEEQIEQRYIQLCATSVVLVSIMSVVLYQIITGHQYFVARRRMRSLEDRLAESIRVAKNLASREKQYQAGDLDFLLRELESAATQLERQSQQAERRQSNAKDNFNPSIQ